MGIGNTSLLIDLLNGATTHVTDLAAGSAQQLVVGNVYTLQAFTADTLVGFGATSAAAITDGDSSHGERLELGAPPRVFVCSSSSVLYVGCSGGTLRIRKAAA